MKSTLKSNKKIFGAPLIFFKVRYLIFKYKPNKIFPAILLLLQSCAYFQGLTQIQIHLVRIVYERTFCVAVSNLSDIAWCPYS